MGYCAGTPALLTIALFSQMLVSSCGDPTPPQTTPRVVERTFEEGGRATLRVGRQIVTLTHNDGAKIRILPGTLTLEFKRAQSEQWSDRRNVGRLLLRDEHGLLVNWVEFDPDDFKPQRPSPIFDFKLTIDVFVQPEGVERVVTFDFD